MHSVIDKLNECRELLDDIRFRDEPLDDLMRAKANSVYNYICKALDQVL